MDNVKFVSAKTIGKCWLDCIQKVMKIGSLHYDEDVKIKEVLGLTVEILNPQSTDNIISKFGDKVVMSKTLKKFSKGIEMSDRPFTYGERIYDMDGIDQFEWLVNRLETKKEAKSATFCLLIPGSMSPNLPCLTTVDAKIREGRLELQFFFRSQNIFGRQYANLMALAKLQKDIADRCFVITGAMRGYIASAHIYSYDYLEAELITSGKNIIIKDKFYSDGPKSIRLA